MKHVLFVVALVAGTIAMAGSATATTTPKAYPGLIPVGNPAGTAVAPGPVAAAPVPVPPPQKSAGADHRDAPSPGRPPSPSNPPPTGTWQPLGPAPIGPPFLSGGGFYGGVNSGRITALAVIPSGTHAGRVVAGTAGGGVWTSDDNGVTWTPRSDQAPSLAIGAVAVDPSNPDHLIAGTGEANQSGDSYPGFGILTSADGGTTWSVQDPGGVFDGLHIAQVAIDPSNSAHMFAATNAGLFVTSNGGTSWALPTDPSYASINGNITAVVIDPSTPTTVYIGGGAAVIAKSTDGGVHWAAASTGIGAPGADPLIALGLAKSSPATLYASVGSTSPVVLYKTTNGGSAWSSVAAPDYTGGAFSYGSGSGDQGWYDNVVAVDPTNPNHVLAGGIALVETTDGGATWTNVNGQAFFGGGTNRIHPDQHALAFGPDGRAWTGDDGGVYLYNPSGPAVTNANGNLNITQFYFGFNEVGGAVLAGSQDNASARTASSAQSAWTGIWSGDGGPSAVTPNHPATQFIEADSGLYRTNDAFAGDLTDITPAGVTSLFTPPETVVASTSTPSDPTVYYGGSDLFRTTNPSSPSPTWTQVTSVGGFVSALAVSPSNPLVVYVGFQNGTIQVSTDGGLTFTSLAAQPFSETFITGLSVDPANPKAITASVSTNDTRYSAAFPHVAQYSYTTTPGSGTWTAITGNLPNFAVSRVVYDHGALIAATDAGVYGTGTVSGGTTSWSPVGTGLPKAQVQDLFVDPVTSNLYAVTHGRGAWMLPAQAQDTVSVTNPGNQNNVSGGKYHLTITGSSSGNYPLTWSATGLPAGMSINSSTGLISGKFTTAKTYSVQVTAKDTTGASGSASFTWTVAAATGTAIKGYGGRCLDAHGASEVPGTLADIYACNGNPPQDWSFTGGELHVLGLCLTGTGGSGSKVDITNCSGASTQIWTHRSNLEYVLSSNGLCLTDPGSSTTNGKIQQLAACKDTANQKWSGT